MVPGLLFRWCRMLQVTCMLGLRGCHVRLGWANAIDQTHLKEEWLPKKTTNPKALKHCTPKPETLQALDPKYYTLNPKP